MQLADKGTAAQLGEGAERDLRGGGLNLDRLAKDTVVGRAVIGAALVGVNGAALGVNGAAGRSAAVARSVAGQTKPREAE